jgi:D-erythrulose 1-phosphate 3-epimerase
MPTITYGTNTCFAVKRWPEPEEWTRIVADLGFEHVQFSLDLADPVLSGSDETFTEIRETAERRGVNIASAFTGFVGYAQSLLGHPDTSLRAAAEDWYRAGISAAATLGARAMGGHIGAMSVREFEDPEARNTAVRRIKEAVLRLSEHAEREGLEALLWEIMPVAREYPATFDEVDELLAEFKGRAAVPVRLCLDTGHACLHGGTPEERDPYEWIERYGDHAWTIHLQQTDGQFDRHWPFADQFNEQGIIDPDRIVDLVAALPQDEVELIFEPVHAFEAPDEQVIADLAASVEYWREPIARLGVTTTERTSR